MRCADDHEVGVDADLSLDAMQERDHEVEEVAPQRGEGRKTALQAARGADSEQLTHHEAQIEGRDVHEIALEDVESAAQVHAAHAAGLQTVREAALDHLAALAHPRSSAPRAHSPTVRVGATLRSLVILPATATALGLAHEALEIEVRDHLHRRVRV